MMFPKPQRARKPRKPLVRAGFLRRGKRLAPKRKTERRSERVRDEAYLAVVRTLPCAMRRVPLNSGPVGSCWGRIDPDHMGPHPKGRLADDDTAVPMCRGHHDARQFRQHGGYFYGWSTERMREWCAVRIHETQVMVALRMGRAVGRTA